jgi:hypothetical protein
MTAVELFAAARGIPFDDWLREAIQEKANRETLQFTVLGLPFVSETDRELAIAELAKAGVIIPAANTRGNRTPLPERNREMPQKGRSRGLR